MSAPATLRLLPDIDVRPTLREVALAYVCRCHDITLPELLGARKDRHLVLARTLFVWIVQTYRPRVSPASIGGWLKRDRCSIIHLSKKAKALLETDEEFQQECARFAAFYARHAGEAL